MTPFQVLMVIALGATAVVDGAKMFKLYNKSVLKIVPLSAYPEVMELLAKAIKQFEVVPKYLLVANQIIRPNQPKGKRCFTTQFADAEGNLFGFSFSHENGKFSHEKAPNGFKDEELTKLVKAGKIDEARKRANAVITTVAAILKADKPKKALPIVSAAPLNPNPSGKNRA